MKYTVLFLMMITSSPAKAEATASALFTAINERLSYMQDVALYKAQNNKAIEDITREQLVINNSKQAARLKGLAPEHIEEFFKAQIAVAKAIQYRFRADILSQPSTTKPRDLIKEIRPALLKLGEQIINHMVDHLNIYGSFQQLTFAEFDAAIDVNYLTLADKQLMFRSLHSIKLLDI